MNLHTRASTSPRLFVSSGLFPVPSAIAQAWGTIGSSKPSVSALPCTAISGLKLVKASRRPGPHSCSPYGGLIASLAHPLRFTQFHHHMSGWCEYCDCFGLRYFFESEYEEIPDSFSRVWWPHPFSCCGGCSHCGLGPTRHGFRSGSEASAQDA